jgi:hypothetical protein
MKCFLRVRFRAGLMASVATCVLTAAGCGVSGPVVAVNRNSDPTRDRLIQVGYAYRESYARTGRPPKSLNDLRPIMKEAGTPEEALVSPRDGKPFEVVWGTECVEIPEQEKAFMLLVYESVGQNGTRYVLWNVGMTAMLSAEEFAKAKSKLKP